MLKCKTKLHFNITTKSFPLQTKWTHGRHVIKCAIDLLIKALKIQRKWLMLISTTDFFFFFFFLICQIFSRAATEHTEVKKVDTVRLLGLYDHKSPSAQSSSQSTECYTDFYLDRCCWFCFLVLVIGYSVTCSEAGGWRQNQEVKLIAPVQIKVHVAFGTLGNAAQ